MKSTTKSRDLKAKLVARLHDPLQLRIAVSVTLLALWYFLSYSPMKERISATTTQLGRDRQRLALATDVEGLRNEAAKFADRLPPRSDPNEFLQYILSGVRSEPIKLLSLRSEKPKEAGPYEVATVQIALEGKYTEMDALLRWVENDKRLLRVDSVKVSPDTQDPELLKIQLVVVGLMGVEEKPKADKDQKPKTTKDEKPRADKDQKPKSPTAKSQPPAPKPVG
jgi:type II secretory pathway component PulM